MIIGTIFTLFVVPVLYSLIARTKRRKPSHDDELHVSRDDGGAPVAVMH
jgi:hypothetical protein